MTIPPTRLRRATSLYAPAALQWIAAAGSAPWKLKISRRLVAAPLESRLLFTQGRLGGSQHTFACLRRRGRNKQKRTRRISTSDSQTVKTQESTRGFRPSRIEIEPDGVYVGFVADFYAEEFIPQNKNRFLADFAAGIRRIQAKSEGVAVEGDVSPSTLFHSTFGSLSSVA